MGNKKKHKKRKRFSFKIFILFILFEVVFTGVTMPLMVFYGPFTNVKRLVVGTSMSSFTHQYIAKMFLSDQKIADILGTNTANAASNPGDQDIAAVKITNQGDNKIDRYDIDGGKYKGYLLIVHDPTKVKVALTKYLGKQGQRVSEIAEENDAIAAINGGGFTDKSADGKLWVGTGGYPTGIAISGGKILYSDVSDNSKVPIAAINKDGKLIAGDHTLNELKTMNIKEALSFGPVLVLNGKGMVYGDGGQGITARTAIGQRKEDGAILLLAVDGRHVNMPGATLKDLEKIMIKYGAYSAVNLDGGSSTTMYYKGDVINNPCNPFGERTVATSIYVEK